MSQNIRLMQIMAGAKTGGAENFFMRLAPALTNAGITQQVAIRKHAARKKFLMTPMFHQWNLSLAASWIF